MAGANASGDGLIGILHGYLLEGSGSNLWTRAIVQALCRAGHDVQLVCQEAHPDIYDFIGAVRVYELDGSVVTLFERETPYDGTCIMHKPRLGDTLPVYVRDRYEEFETVVPMVALPDVAIDDYLERNIAVVTRVVEEHGVTVLHANHAILMSVVAERVGAATGVPFAIMPHGSAIEYAVKKDARFHDLASRAFEAAARVFVIGPELHGRVLDVFPDLTTLDDKITELNLGVDTSAFDLIDRSARVDAIGALTEALKPLGRGKDRVDTERLRARLAGRPDRPPFTRVTLSQLLNEGRGYAEKCPDGDLEAKLATVDWTRDPLLLFVGRLIANKGPQTIVAALPRILVTHPDARLILVGHGPMREVLEAFVWALEQGDRALAEGIVAWGRALEGGEPGPFDKVRRYFDMLDAEGTLDAYFETAQAVMSEDRVIFTGYLTHAELKYLMPCCDVAIFPSIVAEAGPLVFLEALATGAFPLGTNFAGMAASIASVADALPSGDADVMRLSPDPDRTVADIVANVDGALALGGKHAGTLRRAVEARYDWVEVARKLVGELEALKRTDTLAN